MKAYKPEALPAISPKSEKAIALVLAKIKDEPMLNKKAQSIKGFPIS